MVRVIAHAFSTTYRRIFFKSYRYPDFVMQLNFPQSWISLDINTLITTPHSVLIVQGTELCQTNFNKISVPYIF